MGRVDEIINFSQLLFVKPAPTTLQINQKQSQTNPKQKTRFIQKTGLNHLR